MQDLSIVLREHENAKIHSIADRNVKEELLQRSEIVPFRKESSGVKMWRNILIWIM